MIAEGATPMPPSRRGASGPPADGAASGRPGRSTGGRPSLAAAALTVAVLSAALLVAAASGFASAAQAAEAPEGLNEMVTRVVRSEMVGAVVWVRYVETTAESAAELLGKRRDQLDEYAPARVSLVVMHGDFSLGEGRGPYLAFLYWRSGDVSHASDFRVLQRPLPLRSVGEPRAVETFAVAHRTLDRVWIYTVGMLYWFLPVALLAASAILCAWRRCRRWVLVAAAGVALAVAAWQVSLVARSMIGHEWDQVFHGIQLGILAVVVGVELAAALALLWARPAPEADGRADGRATGRQWTGVVLLVVAAVLYVATFPWLATSGD